MSEDGERRVDRVDEDVDVLESAEEDATRKYHV